MCNDPFTNPDIRPDCPGCTPYYFGSRWFFVAPAGDSGYLTNGCTLPDTALRAANAIEKEVAAAVAAGTKTPEWRPQHPDAAESIDDPRIGDPYKAWMIRINGESRRILAENGVLDDRLFSDLDEVLEQLRSGPGW